MKNKKTYTLILGFVLGISMLLSTTFIFLGLRSYAIDEIVMHFGYDNDEIILDKDQMNLIEDKADQVLQQQGDTATYDAPIMRDDSTDGGDGTDGEDTTSVVFDEQTPTELSAEWITVGFLQYALTGDIEGGRTTNNFKNAEGSILNPGDSVESWIAPDITDYSKIYQYSTYAKLFNETMGTIDSGMSTVTYLNTFGKKYDEIEAQAKADGYDDTFYLTVWDDDSSIFKSDSLNLLSQTIEYQEDIATFAYVYSYLWQLNSSEKYDYNLTSLLDSNRYALYWTTTVNDAFFFKRTQEEVLTKDDQAILDNWNDYNDSPYAEQKSNSKLTPDEDGYNGYGGLISKSDSSLTLDSDFWQYDNLWTFRNPYQTEHDTMNGDQEFLSATPYWQSSDSSYLIESSSTDSETGEETTSTAMYMNSLLYPFTFPDETFDEDSGTAKKWNYSLTAYEDPSTPGIYYSPSYVENSDDQSQYQEVNWFDLMSGNIDANVNDKSDLFQLVLLYGIYHQSTTNQQELENSAYSYWNNRGFYIELSGKYQDDYGQYIPEGLLEQ